MCQPPLSARVEDVILEKESARLVHSTGDAFAVPPITSPGDMTLRQMFGGVNPASAQGNGGKRSNHPSRVSFNPTNHPSLYNPCLDQVVNSAKVFGIPSC